jgi:uncharacterized protein (TIGR02271 family)
MKGAGTGAAIGGGLGLVAGLASLAIPGFGPVIAAGPIASALAGAGIGAAAGGMIGALTHVGVPEHEAEYYAEGVRRGGVLVTVRAEDDRADDVADIMENHGAQDVEERAAEWQSSGWQPQHATASTSRQQQDTTWSAGETRSARGDQDFRGEREIPVVEERVDVAKRQVKKGGVRLYTHVTERPVEKTVELRDEEVKVSRRNVDRAATAADMATAFKEGSIELTETREEPIVSKSARVVEEVTVGKEVRDRQQTVRETARKSEVEVQPLDRDFDDSQFRSDFETRYAGRGYQYDRYAPAYQFGSTLSRDARYSNRDWNTIEPEVRRDWESRGHGAWEDFKDSVRYGWDSMRGRR